VLDEGDGLMENKKIIVEMPHRTVSLFGKERWVCDYKTFATKKAALVYRKECMEKAGIWSDKEQAKHTVFIKGLPTGDLEGEDSAYIDDAAGVGEIGAPGIVIFLNLVGAVQAISGLVVAVSSFSEYGESNVLLLIFGLSSILTSVFWFGLARIIGELVKIRRALQS
jgi:hypothetical protein